MSHEIKERKCAAFESRINDLLDARQDPAADESLIRHADRCEACKALFADYLALDDSLSNIVWDAETLARLGAPTGSRPFRMGWSISLAAALLIGFNIVFGSTPWGGNSNAVNLSPTAPQERQVANPRPQLDREPHQPSTDDSIAQAPTGTQLTPVSWNELAERLQPVLNPYYQISAELPGIRPIQSSLYLTIDWVQEKILKHSANRQQKQGFGQYVRLNKPIA